MRISDESFAEYKVLMKRHVGEAAYAEMSEQELYDSAQSLLRLIQVVESNAHNNSENI